MSDEDCSTIEPLVLTDDQIQQYLDQGVLVVDNILSPNEVEEALQGFSSSLAEHAGVDTSELEGTGHGLQALSSTNGSGGVLDVFYDDWKMQIASHPRLFGATTQLWEAAYCHKGETKEDLIASKEDQGFKWHPYGPFDCYEGFMYIDRLGYRLPTALAEKLGKEVAQKELANVGKKQKKPKALQRSLTPHLDCCPETLFSVEKESKWRPVQCFVSLTTNLEANTGGFEAVPGFHHEFHGWAANRPPSVFSKKMHGSVQETAVPASCLGQYTHIRPKEDAAIMKRVQHIPVPAGSAVFWDNRIPHANAYRNDSDQPRAVVYCSFLPNVPFNQPYVEEQLFKYQRRISPTDQWSKPKEHECTTKDEVGQERRQMLSKLGRKLLGADMW
jgi:hypothetical protein